MRITRIESQRRRPDRRNLYADGAFLTSVSAETLLRFGLRTGDTVAPETLAALVRAEELLQARTAALRILATRPRSVREIRDRLREKEFPEEQIARVVADLQAAGLLDDAQFARAYVRNAMATRPLGPAALRRRLLLLGVERAVADTALADTLGPLDQEGIAAGLARDFLRRTRGRAADEAPAKTRARLAAFLARRGYGWDVIDRVARSVLRGAPEEP